MRRWERRLADTAILLQSCGSTYFEPNLFRMNVNQFLTTSRTVGFLINKSKSEVPEFEQWHRENIVKFLGDDAVMHWAVESRNFIEKEGDLELHSNLFVALIYSYLDSEDIAIEVGRTELLRAGILQLVRFAEKKLPSGVLDAAAVRVERRWVANSLPTHELHQALIYVYGKFFAVCTSLALHLGSKLDETIPLPDQFDNVAIDGRRRHFLKLNDRETYSMTSERLMREKGKTRPEWFSSIDMNRPRFEVYAQLAEKTFKEFGSHMAMVFLFANDGAVVQHLGFAPADQTDKFIFWRDIAERIVYLRATSLIFISEVWLRKYSNDPSIPTRKMQIVGEILQIYELDVTGAVHIKNWKIFRDGDATKLGEPEEEPKFKGGIPHFLIPPRDAFEQLRSLQSNK